jgi:hypothetical protein
MKKTWMPKVAGALDIAAGVVGLIAVFGLIVAVSFAQGALGFIGVSYWIPMHAIAVIGIFTIPLFVSSVLAFVGGIFAVQRRVWGLALTGSISAFFPVPILGLVSVILTALAKDEFETAYPQTTLNIGKSV